MAAPDIFQPAWATKGAKEQTNLGIRETLDRISSLSSRLSFDSRLILFRYQTTSFGSRFEADADFGCVVVRKTLMTGGLTCKHHRQEL